MKPTIRLYDAVGTGVILQFPSGVMVSNQKSSFDSPMRLLQ